MPRRRAALPEPRARRAPSPPTPLPLGSPAFLVAALIATTALLVTVTFRFFDYDLWGHLVVGKYLWTAHRIPTTQLWTWPTYGEPAMIPSWLFRALLWPFWSAGGVTGLFVWRWLTALATFAFLFAAARRLRAAPLATLVVLALGALTYRERTMVRPETLALVLFAAQLWILETRRAGGPARNLALVLIACLWINVHVSFYLGFVNLAIHAAGELLAARGAAASPEARADSRRRALGLARVLLIALAASLLNPFGWRAVVQPLAFVLGGRSEAIYRDVTELGGIRWALEWKSGLPLLMVAWPLLQAWRARRRLDLVEALTCVFFTAQALFSQRFKAAYALAAAPYVARNFSEWLASGWRARFALPPWPRVAAAAAAIVALGWMEWSLPQFPIGIGLDPRYVPVRACDFIAANGIRGRAFNHFWYGGYLEYRFWPERDRLPFMDGHLESGTERDRTLATRAQVDAGAWATLDRERRFEWLLLALKTPVGGHLRETIEADSAWAAVFIDDAAAVFVRRAGKLAGVAERHAYRVLRVGPIGFERMMRRAAADPAFRLAVRSEFERQVAESPYSGVAESMLAEIALMEGRRDDARRRLERALVADPDLAPARERLNQLGAP